MRAGVYSRSTDVSGDTDLTQEPRQHLSSIEVLGRDVAGGARVCHVIGRDCLDGGGSLFDGAYGKQAAPTRQVRAESGVLHDRRPSAGHLPAGTPHEVPSVVRNKDVLAHGKVATRRADVPPIRIEIHRDLVRIADTPSGVAQQVERLTRSSGNRYFHGDVCQARERHELRKFEILLSVRLSVE